jgi:hypothetical protein
MAGGYALGRSKGSLIYLFVYGQYEVLIEIFSCICYIICLHFFDRLRVNRATDCNFDHFRSSNNADYTAKPV